MIKKIIKRIQRQPLPCVAVFLLAAILSFSLCYLQYSLEAERVSFEQTCNAIPVHFKITEFDGSKFAGEEGIKKWALNEFILKDGDFNKLAGEIYVRLDFKGVVKTEENADKAVPTTPISGITLLGAADELLPERGTSIRWYEGYDESIFATRENVCIVPEDFEGGDELEITFTGKENLDIIIGEGDDFELIRTYVKHTATFKVVGRYTDEGNKRLYCPYKTMTTLLDSVELEKEGYVSYLGATLANSADVAKLREVRTEWFAEPNHKGEPTLKQNGVDYYLYAMDIEDTLLRSIETNMKNSIFLNKFASVVVFILSATAGFLTGFLTIRSRKREIMLMRSVGESNRSVYFSYAIEQMACVLIGIAFGGAYNLWHPAIRLVIFAVVYYIGFSLALLLFLRKNLLITIKEDE